MGVTKTDFMRGMQCAKMLWLDRHKPELKVIPPAVRRRLDQGNEFGDAAMGLFGPYTEVREYYPGTNHPDKEKMAKKTLELLDFGTPVICEAAFMDADGNYCAVDILRKVGDAYDMYEVKNSPEVKRQFIEDAGFQAYIIRNKIGLNLRKIYIIFNSGLPDSPYEVEEVTEKASYCAQWVADNIGRLGRISAQEEEVNCMVCDQCSYPYRCWYYGYCHEKKKR